MLEENIGPEGTVGGRCGDFCWGNIHTLEIIPSSAVGLHCFGQSIHEVSHAHTPKCLPASDAHPKEVHLQKPEASAALTVPGCTVGLDASAEALRTAVRLKPSVCRRSKITWSPLLAQESCVHDGTSASHTGFIPSVVPCRVDSSAVQGTTEGMIPLCIALVPS